MEKILLSLFESIYGWNGLIARTARSTTTGIGAGLLCDQLLASLFSNYSIFFVSIAIAAFGIWGFYFNPGDNFGGPFIKRVISKTNKLQEGEKNDSSQRSF